MFSNWIDEVFISVQFRHALFRATATYSYTCNPISPKMRAPHAPETSPIDYFESNYLENNSLRSCSFWHNFFYKIFFFDIWAWCVIFYITSTFIDQCTNEYVILAYSRYTLLDQYTDQYRKKMPFLLSPGTKVWLLA